MTTGTGAAVQWRRSELVDILSADFQKRAEPQFALKSMVSQFLAIPGLRGLWCASSFDENGDVYDLSGQGRTLSYQGNPVFNYDNLVPTLELDGTGDYLSRTDEAGLDIIGDESYVSANGLTLGGWFYPTDWSSRNFQGLIGKYDPTGNQRAYLLFKTTTGPDVRFNVSNNGTATTVVPSSIGLPNEDEWHFIVGRYAPSTELAIWVDGTKDTNVTSIPATINNSNANFRIGDYDTAAQNFYGNWCLGFLSAVAVSDAIVEQLYEQSRVAFGRL